MREYMPGDYILDRYMPGASDAERERARDSLYRFVALLVRANERLMLLSTNTIREKSDSALDSDSASTGV